MHRFLLLILFAATLACPAFAQKITDHGYRTVGYIKADGTVQNSSCKTIGHIKPDGTVQDAYKTIGHADGIPVEWAALWFFFG